MCGSTGESITYFVICKRQNGRETLLHIRFRGCPRRHTDAHRPVSLPNGLTTPEGAALLNSPDHFASPFGITESDEDLVEDDVVENRVPCGPESVGKRACMSAGAMDEIGQARATEAAEGLEKPQQLMENDMITKDRWVEIMRAAGLSDDDMHNWHRQFERLEPDAHQEFLESLGIDAGEIRQIRERCRS